ncbi:MAG: alpha/beta hydrolase [Acidimicrobiia bacterium]|nr:alpha/beta hydrolase [Acidimicrobiia bacterium]
MPTSMELDIAGPVHVVDHGGTGKPILLVHGLGGSHVNWSAVAEPLTELGSVRAIDLIGFGRTPPADRSSAVDSQRDLVQAYLRDHADGPAVLVGNSMGGLISMLVARATPELVDSLVLVGPALPVVRPRVDAGVLRRLALPLVPGLGPRSFRNAYEKAIENPEDFLDEMLGVVCADQSRIRPEDREQALAMARERVTMPWAGDAFVDAARSIFRIVIRGRTFARRVASIEAPALVVHGDQDRLVDVASARWLIRQRPGWRLEVLEGIGHVPQLEAPDQFLEIVGAWLADPTAGAAAS